MITVPVKEVVMKILFISLAILSLVFPLAVPVPAQDNLPKLNIAEKTAINCDKNEAIKTAIGCISGRDAKVARSCKSVSRDMNTVQTDRSVLSLIILREKRRF